jgi:hypothetical protein
MQTEDNICKPQFSYMYACMCGFVRCVVLCAGRYIGMLEEHYVCMYICMYVHTYSICMYVCMLDVCMYVHTYVYIGGMCAPVDECAHIRVHA